MRDCNWMQALEGDIDTSHLGFLHLGSVQPEETQHRARSTTTASRDRAPKYDVHETEFGTSYGAYRPAEADTYYWRIAHFLFPFYTMIPTGVLGVQVLVRAWVPIDDEHMMFWSIADPGDALEGQGGPPGDNAAAGSGGAIAAKAGKGDKPSPYAGGLRVPARRVRLARQVAPRPERATTTTASTAKLQRTGQLHGHPGHPPAGPGDHGEHGHDLRSAITSTWAPSDAMVIRTRRRLINAAKALCATGHGAARRRRPGDLPHALRRRHPAALGGLARCDAGPAEGLRRALV